MSSIQNIINTSWQTVTEVSSSAAADELRTQLAGTTDAASGGGENEDGSKTVIERSVITAGDGSKIMVLTQVTLSASGSRNSSKIISRMKIGGPNEDIDTAGTKKTETAPLTQPIAQGNMQNSNVMANTPAIKSAAEKEYEQYSFTGSYDAGLLFTENI